MKINSAGSSASRNIALPALLLAVVLAVLFWRSFLPDYVHFSNDGPLGAQNVDYAKLPGAASGQWDDLNDTGSNAGPYSPSPSPVLKALLGPVGYAKFYQPIALFILGLGALTFFRSLKLSPLAATLGALAMLLNTGYFAGACWGIASLEIAIGFDFLALALIVANRNEKPWHIRWTRLALAGLCVGVNVMEAADVGALCSMFVAAFMVFKAFAEEDVPVFKKVIRSVVRVAVVAIFAGFIATQTVVSLVSTNIEGVAGTAQDTDAKAKQWDWATQWSLPKLETLGIVVPGLFGYRQDTPNNMLPALQDTYRGGVYWGGMGRSPALDRYFDGGSQGEQPPGMMRFGYAGYYCGILVVLAAFWAIVQSFRRQNSPFSAAQTKFIWFWLAVVAISLPLAWGRFAPFSKTSNDLMFYALLYHLPYFSTIRSPSKFLVFFLWALPVLFAYGIHALNCRYLASETVKPAQKKAVPRKWDAFDRKWVFACAGIFGASVVGWLVFSGKEADFIQYLHKVGFGDEDYARQMAAFCLGQVGWFLVIFAMALVLLTLITAGYFSGPRARLGGILLGALLIFDLGRANLPFIIHWNYKQKYEVGTLNPVEKFLSEKSYEHRVVGLPFGSQQQLRGYDNYFGGMGGIYSIEWTQQHFPYYNIQCLDVIQMPRTTESLQAYLEAFSPSGTLDSLPLLARHWELTNTRYLLGAMVTTLPNGNVDTLSFLNGAFDPKLKRFRIAKRFDIVAKPGIAQPSGLEELTAQTNDTGDLAVFDFTGALPRVKLYTDWQTNSSDMLKNFSTNNLSAEDLHIFGEAGTNGFLTLKKLASPSFDPQQTVLLDAPLPEGNPSGSTNQNSGTVEFYSYSPEHIVFAANAVAPSVLLLNDKYDPNWHVTVDGKPANLLRCNFMMRGVFLPSGAHTVKFDFSLTNKPLYVTLTAMGLGLCLVIFLVIALKRESSAKR